MERDGLVVVARAYGACHSCRGFFFEDRVFMFGFVMLNQICEIDNHSQCETWAFVTAAAGERLAAPARMSGIMP